MPPCRRSSSPIRPPAPTSARERLQIGMARREETKWIAARRSGRRWAFSPCLAAGTPRRSILDFTLWAGAGAGAGRRWPRRSGLQPNPSRPPGPAPAAPSATDYANLQTLPSGVFCLARRIVGALKESLTVFSLLRAAFPAVIPSPARNLFFCKRQPIGLLSE
jgi:hypothetical protein